MSENTNVQGGESNGTTATVEKKRRGRPANGETVVIVEYETKEECEQNKPANTEADAWKPYCVTDPNGKECWIWAVGSVNALAVMAKKAGWAASLGTPRGRQPLTVANIAAHVTSKYSEQEKAALLEALGYKPQTASVEQPKKKKGS